MLKKSTPTFVRRDIQGVARGMQEKAIEFKRAGAQIYKKV